MADNSSRTQTEAADSSPVVRRSLPLWLRLLRQAALRRPGFPGLYSLLRLCHHPDRREKSFYSATVQLGADEPRFHLETRYFTDWQIYFFGTQDRFLDQWIRDHVRKDWVCLDVGANIGFFTVQMARRAARCIAFEPIPRFADRTEKNLALNRLTNASVVRCALSDVNETGELFLPPEKHANWGASSLVRPQGGAKIPVTIRRLDDFVRSAGLDRIDLVKIDVEGAEHLVLKGARGAFARFRPRTIFENNRESGPETIGLLRELGYEFFDLRNRPLNSADELAATPDVLAVPAEDRAVRGPLWAESSR